MKLSKIKAELVNALKSRMQKIQIGKSFEIDFNPLLCKSDKRHFYLQTNPKLQQVR
jgi:hypothetical protein